MATGAKNRARSGQRGKGIEDVVSYAISHQTRVQILIVLNQGTYCTSELSKIIGEPINHVANHLKELADGGAIEIAETKRRRNFDQHFYRAIETALYSKEDLLEMHPLQRQMVAGLHVQGLLAEVMAALWSGKFSEDPNHCFVWDRLNVDDQGRDEITEEQERHWERLAEIEKKSLLRTTKTFPYIISVLGFRRGRKAPVAPP